jgi:hypothetical protein
MATERYGYKFGVLKATYIAVIALDRPLLAQLLQFIMPMLFCWGDEAL